MAVWKGQVHSAPMSAGRVRAARGVAVVCGAAAVVLAVLQLIPPFVAARDQPLAEVAFVTAFVVTAGVGLVIVWHRPGNAVGWILLGSGLCVVLAGALTAYAYRVLVAAPGTAPGGVWARWADSWLYVASFWLGWTLPLFLLPDGHLPSRRWRPVFAVTVGVAVLATGAQALRPGPIGDVVPVMNPVGVDAFGTVLPVVDTTTSVGLVVAIVVGFGSVVSRWRRSHGPVRRQLAHVLAGVLLAGMLLVADIVLAWLGVPETPVAMLAAVAFVLPAVGIGLAVLRAGMLEIDVVVSRTLVWSLISTTSVLTYAVVLVGTSRWLAGESGVAVSLLATIVVALALGALRQRVEPRVRHRLFGPSDRPYQALTGLGAALSTHAAPPPAEAVAAWVCQSLGLSSATVEQPSDPRDHASPRGTERFDLVYDGRVLGALVVEPPPGASRLTTDERIVLEDASRQAATAMHAEQLAREVQRSRAELVRAHEQERRRIRRDVHVGIGPALAAVPLQLDALVERLDPADLDGRELADRVKRGVREAVGDLRLLIDGLRPRSLDRLGLDGALRERLAAAQDGGLEVTGCVDIAGFDVGPAAEVAVLHVMSESLANVVRHAEARRVDVMVRCVGPAVQVDVADDGRGLARDIRPGVGLDSMRLRTAELSGHFELGRGPLGGLQVRARIPRDGA